MARDPFFEAVHWVHHLTVALRYMAVVIHCGAQLAADFVASGGVGETLHKLICERARQKDNWLSDWWLEGAYMGYRNPVVVYSSPALSMPRQEFRSSKDQLAYAASLIQAVLDFKVLHRHIWICSRTWRKVVYVRA